MTPLSPKEGHPSLLSLLIAGLSTLDLSFLPGRGTAGHQSLFHDKVKGVEVVFPLTLPPLERPTPRPHKEEEGLCDEVEEEVEEVFKVFSPPVSSVRPSPFSSTGLCCVSSQQPSGSG